MLDLPNGPLVETGDIMKQNSIANRLRRSLTPTAPLGPSDAAQITDLEVAARLFDPHNKSFNTLLRRDLSVLIGRRGSGKTALLNSYKYRPYLDKYDTPSDARFDFLSYEIVIDVLTYRQFDEMQRLVARDPGAFRPVEALVDDWASLVGDYFFARLVSGETEEGRVTEEIHTIRRYLDQEETGYQEQVRKIVWGNSLWDKIKSFVFSESHKKHPYISPEGALDAAVEHLYRTSKRALILFDSMDEYDITNAHFTRTLGALIRFISQFNARQERIKIKLGLPSEIFPEVQRASANPLKDLVSVDQLKWTAMELAQIAAHRYLLFLGLYDSDHAVMLGALDLNKRNDVRKFWSHFLPAKLTNRYGQDEEPMTYIMRHTQLLPRQLLMILQKIIVISAGITGGFREFKSEAVTEAIEGTEPLIATEILSAFAHVYPFAEEVCKPVFANFPTVFSFDELEDKWRKKGRHIVSKKGMDFDMPNFGEMLIRMGIVGVGHEETERYYQGAFGYDSLSPANIGDGQSLCLHPVFSKHFNAAGNSRRKAVIPQGVAIRWS
jgi:GTPase SAR1 family protein